jgi:hypothetical protein
MKLIEKLFRGRQSAIPERDPATDRYPTGLPLPLLAELVMLIREVTEEDIERAARSLKEPADGEKVLGRVTAVEHLQLWALYSRLRGRSEGCKHRAAFESDTAADAEQAQREAERWIDLAMIAARLFWVAAKDDIEGAWAADAAGKMIDIRSGFRLVAADRQNPMAEFIGRFGGPV